jgi:hypothetical protein
LALHGKDLKISHYTYILKYKMIPKLTIGDKLNMSLSQINRYEKKYTKMTYNNDYYIQYYGYDVELICWDIKLDENDFIYATGCLGNGNLWETSDIVSIKTRKDHYRCKTSSGTVYRLYWE